MWDTGVAAGEANVAEGLGVDPPPPLTRGGWVGGRVVATRPEVTQVTKRFQVTKPLQVTNETSL